MSNNPITAIYVGVNGKARKVFKSSDFDGGGGGGGSSIYYLPTIYSLEEREVGVWTDGKPLYEKTIQGQFSSGSLNCRVDYNVTNIAKCVKLEGFLVPSDDGNRGVVIGAYNDLGLRFSANDTYQSNGYCTVQRGGVDYCGSAPFVYITIQYTKTTDTAGSGTWTPGEVPAHHYSTDEQVIGTWVDGKTLYEKTYSGLSVTSSTSFHSIGITLLGVDTLVSANACGGASDGRKITFNTNVYIATDNVLYSAEFANGWLIKSLTIQYTKSSS